MASLMILFGRKANVIGRLARFSSHSTWVARFSSHSRSGFDEVGEDAIIHASMERSKYPYNTDVHNGRYNFLLRKFVRKKEEEEAEKGLFLRDKVFPLLSEHIDPSLCKPVPHFVREMNGYLLDLYDYQVVYFVATKFAPLPDPSTLVLESDFELLKVLAKETVVGGIEAAEKAYASSPSMYDRLIENGIVRLALTEIINPKDQEARLRQKVSGIGTLDVEKMVLFFRVFVIPLKTTVAVRHLLSKKGD